MQINIRKTIENTVPVLDEFPFYVEELNASDEMLSIGVKALRIIAIHFPLAAISIILGSVFQALGKGVQSMVISFVRQLIFLLPAAWLLSLTGNINNIWWAFPIAEVLSLIICCILFAIASVVLYLSIAKAW